MSYVVGQDFRLHRGYETMSGPTVECRGTAALRHVSTAEARFQFWKDRLCPRCFPKEPGGN